MIEASPRGDPEYRQLLKETAGVAYFAGADTVCARDFMLFIH
jgi:hypothetical protein